MRLIRPIVFASFWSLELHLQAKSADDLYDMVRLRFCMGGLCSISNLHLWVGMIPTSLLSFHLLPSDSVHRTHDVMNLCI
jgi:hypothetical protein